MKIKPYKINIPEAQLADLKSRLKAMRWPDATPTSNDWSRGVPLDYLKELTHYWEATFDWREQEAALNKFDQYIAEVDGQPIHFFHVTSKVASARPLMLLHGWPSSGIEFIKMIDALTDPVAHGGRADEAFHVVIPTIPGFGLSSPVTSDWDVPRTTAAFDQIMQELGYKAYAVCGGDVGAGIASALDQRNKQLLGVLACTDPDAISWFLGFTGGDVSANPALSDAQKKAVQERMQSRATGEGYLEIQKTRPLTIGYLLNDSPVGQLAWIIEKYKEWTADGTKLPQETLDIDHALTNISLYWFTRSGATAASLLHNNLTADIEWGATPNSPTGTVVFGAEGFEQAIMDPQKQSPHWTEFKKGGHFPAMEVPELLVQDLRAFFAKS